MPGLFSKKAKLSPIPIVELMSNHNKPTESEVAILKRKSRVSGSISLISERLFVLHEGKNNCTYFPTFNSITSIIVL
jgi:hypothetical protein